MRIYRRAREDATMHVKMSQYTLCTRYGADIGEGAGVMEASAIDEYTRQSMRSEKGKD